MNIKRLLKTSILIKNITEKIDPVKNVPKLMTRQTLNDPAVEILWR